jgi:membrane-bound lytic murein transglycosylase D
MGTAKHTLTLFAILLASGCASLNTTAPQPPLDHPDSTSVESGAGSAVESPPATTDTLQDDTEQEPTDGDFWHRLQEGFHLNTGHHQAVTRRIEAFSRETRQIESTLQRGRPYLAYIYEQVKKRNFPNEIVLLPFIESGYDPYAYSHGKAAGLWQFVPATGADYGLRQDWWYDGRRDVVASTNAALNYLDKLQQEFDGDWLLALAAYNAGEGTVSQAIKSNQDSGKPTDFWHLNLPQETSAYVPKLLAISAIIKHPGRYGVSLVPVDTSPTFTVIDIHGQLDLAVAAELAEINTRELRRLNPGFNRWATNPQGPHRLLVPVDKSSVFEQNLAALPPSRRVQWLRHKVRRGDTLIRIANRYDTTVEVLRKFNKLRGNTIRTGQHLVVPVAVKNPGRYAALFKDKSAQAGAGERTYRVRRGDSLWKIAHTHGISIEQLAHWNDLDSGAAIQPGQHLTIRSRNSTPRSVNTIRSISYTVRRGDSLYLISQKYNVSITDLKSWNGLERQKYLKPGQKLKLQIDVVRLAQDDPG